MGTESDADVEWLLEMKRDGRAKLVHGLALQAHEDGNRVSMFFDSHALGLHPSQRAPEANLRIVHHAAVVRAPCQVDRPGAMLAEHRLFGIVFEVLANHQN